MAGRPVAAWSSVGSGAAQPEVHRAGRVVRVRGTGDRDRRRVMHWRTGLDGAVRVDAVSVLDLRRRGRRAALEGAEELVVQLRVAGRRSAAVDQEAGETCSP